MSLLLLCSNFFLLTTKYVLIISNRRNYAITIHFRFPAFFTLPLHYLAARSFILFGRWKGVCHLALKVGKNAEKIGERCPTSVIPKYFEKLYSYTFQRTKIYLFCCSVFQVDCFFVSKNEDLTIKMFFIFRHYEQQVLSHKDRLFAPLPTGLLEK